MPPASPRNALPLQMPVLGAQGVQASITPGEKCKAAKKDAKLRNYHRASTAGHEIEMWCNTDGLLNQRMFLLALRPRP